MRPGRIRRPERKTLDRRLARLLPLLAAALLAPRAALAAPAPQGARTLHVAVASSLKPAFEEIATAFAAQHPGVEVDATYGASGKFVAQILGGAPFDVFLSADVERAAAIAREGLAAGEPFPFARGALAVWVPAGSKLDLARGGLAALADPSVRKIAVANPIVAPYGRAAEDALRAAGVHEKVRDRLTYGQNAWQAAQLAGDAQAAILPLSLVVVPPLSTGRHQRLPDDLAPPLANVGVVLKAARDPQLARELAAFLAGPGRAILEKHGYAVPR
jgi:molybdate transport system substrate-binding protein